MTEKELKSFTINYIDKKVKENEEFIRYTYYELKVANNLSEEEINEFLRINKDYFENKSYRVYFTDDKFVYNKANRTVQSNELMIAIKDEEGKK